MMSVKVPERKTQAAFPPTSVMHKEKTNHYFRAVSQGKQKTLFYSDYFVQACPLHSVPALATNQSLFINIWKILSDPNNPPLVVG